MLGQSFAPPTGEPVLIESPIALKRRELEQHGRDIRLGRQIFALSEEEEAQPLPAPTGKRYERPAMFYAEGRDEARAKLAQAEKEAMTDELTGLLNRRGFMNKLQNVLSSPDLDQDRYVLVYMDLNGFKPVNEAHGHEAGDKVLNSIGHRLNLRKSDIAGRIGGDEFVILADTRADVADRRGSGREDDNPRRTPKTREEVIKGLREHLAYEVELGGFDAGYGGITASIGVEEIGDNREAQSIINKADAAMQAHKTSTQAGR